MTPEAYTVDEVITGTRHLRGVHGVYAILNAATGKAYVGGTVDLCSRLRTHRCKLIKGTHTQSLQRDWEKFGADSFWFLVLEVVPFVVDIGLRELYWQKKYRATGGLYNRFDGRDFQHHKIWSGAEPSMDRVYYKLHRLRLKEMGSINRANEH